ncbi:tRNA (adenine(22)-N(1))-methyltransferase [Phosphitispora sp. TUW77]|uniref:tRNA (adenine(22)-N(1))-methyltransferase n=1 Tax=Phosphitispora sp. TUW77 TaxID=3152361 RepID=UPI003AB8D579
MRLTKRLMTIAKFISTGSVVADIGTDHAMLPVYLIKNGISEKVIAGDLNKGPLEMAKKNVIEAGFLDRIFLRQGNGLEIISSGEVDTAVISGMGGSTIREIIQNAGSAANSLKKMVLQPMNDSRRLRKWLVENGWAIDDEEIVEEDSRLYEIVCVVRGVEKTMDIDIVSVGPRLFEKKHPLLLKLIRNELENFNRIVSDMEKSALSKTILKRSEVQREIDVLERIEKCLLLNARQ